MKKIILLFSLLWAHNLSAIFFVHDGRWSGWTDIGTVSTFADLDVTPNVDGGAYFNTFTNAIILIDFDGGELQDGALIFVNSKAAVTYDCTGAGFDCGDTDGVTASGDLVVWLYTGINWQFVSFHDLSEDVWTDAGDPAEWTDTGSILHPVEETVDEIVIGGTTEAGADIFLGVDGTAVFNEQGNSVDFRIESSGNSNMFVIHGADDEVHIGGSGGFDTLNIHGDMDLIHTATFNDDHAFEIELDAAGFGDVKAIDIVFTTGAIEATEVEGVILINIDESASSGGDINAIEVLTTTVGSATVHGIQVGVGVGPIFQQSGAFGNVGFCEETSDDIAFTDCTAAFNSTGTDIQIWDADDDRIYIGEATTFSEIEWIWDTVTGNPGIQPTFEYWSGAAWSTFSPADGTNGARNNGAMIWTTSALSGWATTAIDGDTKYWIRITRTANSVTGPTEDLVQTAAPTNFSWNLTGDLVINTIGAITQSNLMDKTAAEVITGVFDFGGAAAVELANNATPTTDATGEIALDTTITDHQPLFQYFDGAENMTIIAIDTAELPALDNEIIKYNAATDKFVLEADAGGGGTALTSLPLPVQSAKITGAYVTDADATQGAQIDAGEGNWRGLFDATVDEAVVWGFRMPDNYSSDPLLKIGYSMFSATSGTVEFEGAIMCVSDGDAADLATPSFSAIAVATETVPGTVGYLSEVSITLTDDSCTAGDFVYIYQSTDADDGTNDTATGDRENVYTTFTYTGL